MLLHTLTEGEIPFVQSANGNGNRILLNGIPFNGIPFPFISIKKILKVLFPFVSIKTNLGSSVKVPFLFVFVKTNFESSIKITFPLMALCFRVNPYQARWLERLAELNLEVHYVPGKDNVAADVLSRYG